MIKNITTVELKNKISENTPKYIIDVREKEEYESSHIENSHSIPVTEFKSKYQELLTDKNEEIILICRSGGRSMVIAIFLDQEGYSNIINVDGGVLSWNKDGNDLTPTNEILPSKLTCMPDFF